jgi:capsular polysaccharide transport system permease protein
MTVSSQDGASVEQIRRPELKAVEAPAADKSAPVAPPKPPIKSKPKPAAKPTVIVAPQPTPQMIARPRRRHYVGLASFALLVLLPLAAAVWYLYARAADQYHSEVAFSIRSEDTGVAAAGILGAITQIGSGTASDTDILFEFIRSQQIVEAIDHDLDLRGLYNRAESDPVFTLGGDASIEDLLAHWRRMVDVRYEARSGIIHVRANAFTPEDAGAVTRAILAESTALVNRLSDRAREDAIRYAREDLTEAEAHLHTLRQRLTEFRRTNRLVDPAADAEGQVGLLNALQRELAQALVERDMLLSYAGDADQRVIQVNRRIDAITGRIEAERQNLGVARVEGTLPEIIGAYEEQLVDLEFASSAYTQALANLAAARADARRQSRYLAPHIEPTRAETALYPQRSMIAGLTGLFLLLGWGVLLLVYYNVRDNR